MIRMRTAVRCYLLIMLIIGSYTSMNFFNDVAWYYEHQHSPDFFHRLLIQRVPFYYFCISLMSFYVLWRLVALISLRHLFVFLHPYALLLVSAPMKEQLVAFGCLIYMWKKSQSKQVVNNRTKPGLAVFVGAATSPRLIYLPMWLAGFFARIKPLHFSILLLLSFIIILCVLYGAFFQNIFDILMLRSSVEHVGRPYFVGLCIEDKASPWSFFVCWFSAIMGAPFHPDILTFNYVIYMSFTLLLYLTIFNCFLVGKRFFAIGILALLTVNFVLFWWGPTLGASTRYFLPFLWVTSALVAVTRTKMTFNCIGTTTVKP